jgi:ABC-type sugar transport system substrate-binding protein
MQQKRIQSALLRVLSSATLALALLLLTACNSFGLSFGSGNLTPTSTAISGKNPTSIHVGFVSETTSQDFALEMAAGAQYAANQFHVSAQIVAPPTIDDPAAVKLFDGLTKTARDGIAVETLSPDLFVQPEARAVSEGIPVIAVDTVPPAASHITTYVGNDNLAAGATLANAAIEHIPTNAQGNLLIGVDISGIPVLNYRIQGIEQEFRRMRPAIHIVTPFNSQQVTALNLASWNSEIKAHSNIVACLGVGDPDNASLAQIKQEQHATYLSGAFDLDPTALQAIVNGTNFALLDPEHFLKGYVAMRLLIEHALYGKAIPRGWWNPGDLLVTQNNVQQIITRQQSLANKGQFYQLIIDEEFADPSAYIKPLDQAK